MIPQHVRKNIDRFQGAMASLALGDAAGAPYDGFTRATIRKRFAMVRGIDPVGGAKDLLRRVMRGERARKVAKAADAAHPPGLYNSATQQALIAAERIVMDGSVDPARFAQECARFLFPSKRGKFGQHRKPSVAFKAAINRFAAGEPALSCADEPAVIESAFRAVPVGLEMRDDPAAACAAAAALAAVTDRSPEGAACAAATAALCGFLCGANGLPAFGDAVRFLRKTMAASKMTAAADPGDDGLAEGVEQLGMLLSALVPWMPSSDEPGADDQIAQAVSTELAKLGRDVNDPGSGFAPCAFATAMAIALSEPSGPERAILRAVNLGGKTSWIAGLAGAFSGAVFGRERISASWMEALWNRKAILRIAELLARPSERPQWPGDLYEIEKETNERAAEYRAGLRATVLEAGKAGPA